MKRIFISAGDISGDIHAADLARALKEQEADLRIAALGGPQLMTVADTFLADLTSLSAFGFFDPVKQYFRLKEIFEKQLMREFDLNRPDRVILVDYYGFNIHVAKEAYRRQIPVYYYISPQVWASRAGRIGQLKKYVKKMLVILPFEEEMYYKAGLDAVFVGHPLIDRISVPVADSGTISDKITIGLFPGSRPSYFRKHLPVMLAAAQLIKSELACEFKIFTLPSLASSITVDGFKVVTEKGYDERRTLTAAITTSGTVSLENTLLGIPMVVMYRLSAFNYFLARHLVKVRYITMANILGNREIVPELIQDRATPELIAAETLKLLRDNERREAQKKELASFRKILGAPGVAARAAALILNG
jgi:lipid-A-disaccharide synthase